MSKLSNDDVYNLSKQHKAMEETLDRFNIVNTRFEIYSYEDIKNVAVCEVYTPYTTGINGVNDSRMGPVEEKTLCETCHKTMNNCPGHYGYIDLAVPIVNPEMKSCVLALLSTVCNFCSSMLLSKSFILSDKTLMAKKGVDRLQALKALAEKCGKCPRKGVNGEDACTKTPVYKKNDNKDSHIIRYTCQYVKGKNGSSSQNTIPIQDVYNILDGIKDEDLPYLGFGSHSTHPREMIMRAMLVPPPVCRPPLYQDGDKKLDFVTLSYINIISTNEKLKSVDASENDKKDWEKKINISIFNLISATGEGTVAKSGGTKSIRKKFNGKDGIPRCKAMGKRIDYAGRTVIGGDSTLPFGWVSIPQVFADTLTKQVYVNHYNVDVMRSFYDRGLIVSNKPKGGKYANNLIMITPHVKEHLVPKIGDLLEVKLMNGDIVTPNRQPTLHKAGMMSARALIHKGHTMKIHSSITEAINGDFDGDDANVYMPQSDRAITESMLLSSVYNNISDFQTSAVMTSLYYHARVGAYTLSQPNVVLDEEDWQEALCIFRRSMTRGNGLDDVHPRFKTFDKRVEWSGIHPRSGRALISCMLPEDMFFEEYGLTIHHGVLIEGILDAKSMGGFGLIHQLVKNYGPFVAQAFITEAQWIFDWYLTLRSVSVGLCHIIPENKKELDTFVESALSDTQTVVNMFYSESMSERLREAKILSALAHTEDNGKKLATKFLRDDNPYVIIYSSGAKGSSNSMKCMMAMFGQEVNSGARPALRLSNESRFCCFNDYNDHDVRNRGFITESFVEGLSPISFIMHMNSARDGINASNLATPDAGFMGRRLNNFLNNVRIGTMGQTELTNGNIVQLIYGDGFDTAKITLNRSRVRGTEKYFMNVNQTVKGLLFDVLRKRKMGL